MHIEDFLLDSNIDVDTIIASITDKAFPYSIKWDGCFSFVIGRDTEFFIAFKNGYAKKSPEKYYSVEQISDTIASHDLAAKMVNLFDHFESLSFDGVLHGDYMFDDSMIVDGQFQPNTVKYRFIEPNTKSLGVAIHNNGHTESDRIMFIAGHEVSYRAKIITCRIPIRLDVTRQNWFKKYVNSCVRNGHMDIHVDEFYDFCDAATQRHIKQNFGVWVSLIDNYLKIVDWKDRLLSTVDARTNIIPADGYAHEGLVFDLGNDTLVKLVNRITFSSVNFNRIRYGW